jgi:hypothetical protein
MARAQGTTVTARKHTKTSERSAQTAFMSAQPPG